MAYGMIVLRNTGAAPDMAARFWLRLTSGATPRADVRRPLNVFAGRATVFSGRATVFSGRRYGGLGVTRPNNCQKGDLRRETIPQVLQEGPAQTEAAVLLAAGSCHSSVISFQFLS